MVILATRKKEIGTNPLLDANCTFDANKEREFSIKIARCNWTEDMTYGNLVYVPDTEYGGIIGSVLTDTTLDYVELKQSLEDEYKQYHTLKGNGVGTQMYHALMELPTEPQHEREE